MPIRFRFRVIPFLATVLVVALGISLGNWQARRAADKRAVAAQVAARAALPPLTLTGTPATLDQLAWRRVRLTGQFVPRWPILLDNRPYQGRAGFYFLMPFKIANSDTHVLVARGWVPRDPADPRRVPAVPTPEGEVAIEGFVTGSLGRLLQLGTPAPLAPGAIVQDVAPQDLDRISGMRLQPFFVAQTGPADDSALVRDWPAPSTGIEKHEGYAFQWYALAVMACLFYVITGIRSGTHSHGRRGT